ncbi:methyl-accepting chemotaxis protein [Rugamonas sp. DEMB1]|uniref:methyl-accepting chemotaxis protein n=1 Tax=Rugamonas sp. DEMB1 TaxID=3039386 RepID=UPI002446F206|nr:methyl-accepting chemotaxis protein [Rugamonas sp. DEMB1]WGG48328.1 methyl-accepting chemotaxis protein [Rugamonas sp. DEMB1]
MNLANLKITMRLGLLGGFFCLALLLVGLNGWRALSQANGRSETGMQQAATLTDAIDTARSAQVEFKDQIQAWKNILVRGGKADEYEKYLKEFKRAADKTHAELLRVNALLAKLSLATPLVDDAIKMHEQLAGVFLPALQLYDAADPASVQLVDAEVRGRDRPTAAKIDETVRYMEEQTRLLMAALSAQNQAAHTSATVQLLVELLLTVLLGGAIVLWLARGIIGPLNEAVAIAQVVADGDLSKDIAVNRKDEIGTLLAALKHMHDSLAGIVGQVRGGTDAIALASAEIAQGNQDLSARTEAQASALEETASSMEQLTAAVRQTSENASQASVLAGGASAVALRGGADVAEVIATMDSINEASKKIVDIIAVIDGIAFQTNILALNAAVEAARAGEQGRGFAVVASEVRNLAQRSAAAAKEIKELISHSVERVEAGGKLVARAGATMDEVVSSVQRVTGIIGEIAVASGEQNAGISQVNQAIAEMDNATQQNAALVEQAAAAAASMQQQAAVLHDSVSVFKIHANHAAPAGAAPRGHTQAAATRPASRLAAPRRAPASSAGDDWETF